MKKIVQTNNALSRPSLSNKGGRSANVGPVYTFDTTLCDLHVIEKRAARITRPSLSLITDRKTGRIIFSEVLGKLSSRTRRAVLTEAFRRLKEATFHGEA